MTSTSKDVLYPLPAEVLSIAANFCYSCGKELNEKGDEPKSEMSDDSSAVSANDLITEMFHRGYRYDVILHLLAGALYTKSPVTSLRTVFCTFISMATSLSGLKVQWFDGSLVRWIVGSMVRAAKFFSVVTLCMAFTS